MTELYIRYTSISRMEGPKAETTNDKAVDGNIGAIKN